MDQWIIFERKNCQRVHFYKHVSTGKCLFVDKIFSFWCWWFGVFGFIFNDYITLRGAGVCFYRAQQILNPCLWVMVLIRFQQSVVNNFRINSNFAFTENFACKVSKKLVSYSSYSRLKLFHIFCFYKPQVRFTNYYHKMQVTKK